MPLLNFPPSPVNGDIYPSNPLPGQSQYEWSSADNTWRLLGPATGIIPGCYGDGSFIPTICFDAQGRATSVTVSPFVAVTYVGTGVGLLGGPITTTGTLDLDVAYTDTLYLSLAGGTLTGDVTFAGTQTFPGVLELAGGTMTGDIAFAGTQTFPNTVTSVTAGTGLLGGTITSTGTIDLDTAYTDTFYLSLAGGTLTGDVTFAGTQTFPGVLPLAGGTMTGDIAFAGTQTFPGVLELAGGTMTGDITFAGTQTFPNTVTSVTGTLPISVTPGATPDVSVADATLIAKGVVQLEDSVASSSTTTAATPNSVKTAYDLAAAALPLTGGTLTGAVTFDPAQTFPGTATVVAAPTASTDPGATGQIAVSAGFFYWYDGTQWLQVAGSVF